MTTASKHTPGPWHREGFGQNARGQKFILVSHGRNAQCDGPEGYVGELYVSEADARLMIAAPAMLAAILEALPQAEGCFADHYGNNPEGGALPKHIELMRAAVAKAEGR